MIDRIPNSWGGVRQRTDEAAIRLCVDRCARAQDGRGPWQAEKSLRNTLAASGTASIAAGCAAAARRIGEWIGAR